MFLLIKKIEDDNFEKLNSFIRNKIENLNNIDVSLCEKIEIDIGKIEATIKDKEDVFNHLFVSKTIAQIAVNRYKNNNYYNDSIFYNLSILSVFEKENDNFPYATWLEQLVDKKVCEEQSLKDILRSSTIIYIITCKILKAEEDSLGLDNSSLENQDQDIDRMDSQKMNNSFTINTNDYISQPSEVMDSHNSLTQKSWQCTFCDTFNSEVESLCEVCAGEKPLINKENKEKYCKPKKERCENILDNKKSESISGRQYDTVSAASVKSEYGRYYSLNNNGERKGFELNDDNKKTDKNISRNKFLKESTLNKVESLNNHNKNVDLFNNNGTERWRCSKCSMLNSYEASKCSVCEGYGPLHDKWRCDTCNKINRNDDIECNDCHKISPFIKLCPQCDISIINIKYYKICEKCATFDKERNKQEIIENNMDVDQHNIEDVVEEWSCSKCSLRNLFDKERCSACDNVGPHYNKWRCSKCTMINGRLDIQCSVCHEINTFIEKCSLCDVSIINIKYNKICEICETFGKVKNELEIKTLKEENIKKEVAKEVKDEINNIEKWSCSKCSLRNLFDIERCSACDNVGPHYNKWRCSKCTAFNYNCTIICQVCGNIKILQKQTNDNLLYSQVDTTLEDQKLTHTYYNSTLSSRNKQRFNDRFCKKCAKSLVLSENNLCYTCKGKYYICSKDTCGSIVDIAEEHCPCGEGNPTLIKVGRPLSIIKDISYNKEEENQTNNKHKYNERYCKLCKVTLPEEADCLCYKCKVDYYICPKYKCGRVVGPRKTKCDYCDVNKDHNKDYKEECGGSWTCTWRLCKHINKEGDNLCRICYCYKDDKGKLKCTHCGFIGYNIGGKCDKCSRDCEGSLKYTHENVENQKNKWKCPYRKCEHLNEENYTLCRICHCYKDDKGKLKCTHCGYIGYNIGGKCDKCSRL